jgi:hypothetical protein
LTSAFFGSVRIWMSAVFAQRHQRRDDGQTPDELGDHAELDDVLVADLLEEQLALVDVALSMSSSCVIGGGEADAV